MGDDPNKYRGALEQIARRLIYARQNPELFWWYRPPKNKSDRAGVKIIATAARRILRELEKLSAYASGEMQAAFAADGEIRPDNKLRMSAFHADVARLASLAEFFHQNGFGFKFREKPNFDDTRNRVWAQATYLWEQATGKRASAYERSQAYERVPADGPIVRFLIVFTKAIRKAFPAEPEARGDAIRWWLRHYWGPKRNRFSLDIDFST